MWGLITRWWFWFCLCLPLLCILGGDQRSQGVTFWDKNLHHFLWGETGVFFFFFRKRIRCSVQVLISTQNHRIYPKRWLPPMSQCAEIAKEKRCRALWNVMIAPLLMYLVWRYTFRWSHGIMFCFHSFNVVGVDAMTWCSFWMKMEEIEGCGLRQGMTRANRQASTFFWGGCRISFSCTLWFQIAEWVGEAALKVRFVHRFYTHSGA